MNPKILTWNVVKKAFINLKGVRSYEHDTHYIEGVGRDFRYRLSEMWYGSENNTKDGKYIFEMAVKKSFDRWANSVSFVQEIPMEDDGITIDFNKAVKQARKVVKSGAFDFNGYFYKIYLDAGIQYKLGRKVKV